MKNDAGISWRSIRSTTRCRPTRAPYSPCDMAPIDGSALRAIWMVSLSTSNEIITATRAPFGQDSGCRLRPARTRLAMARISSRSRYRPGWLVWVVCAPGASVAKL